MQYSKDVLLKTFYNINRYLEWLIPLLTLYIYLSYTIYGHRYISYMNDNKLYYADGDIFTLSRFR